MISEAEQYESARMMVGILEQRLSQAVASRRAAIAKVVDLLSADRLYWYVSTSTGISTAAQTASLSIQILQDAAFVATGIHVIGQELQGAQFLMSLQNGWPRRDATQTQNLPVFTSGISPANQPKQISATVPIDHFMPAYTSGNTVGIMPPNVDYWYQPLAEWLVPRGDTILITTQMDNGDVPHPVVVLSGRKVTS